VEDVNRRAFLTLGGAAAGVVLLGASMGRASARPHPRHPHSSSGSSSVPTSYGGSGNTQRPSTSPPAGGGGSTTATIFTTQTPATSVGDNQVVMGTAFTAETTLTCTAGRYYKADSLYDGLTMTMGLWDGAGTLITSTTRVQSAGDPIGWITVTWPAAVNILPTSTWTVGLLTPGNNGYYYTTGGLTSAVDNSPLHSVATGGRYLYNATLARPTNTTTANFFIDVLVNVDQPGYRNLPGYTGWPGYTGSLTNGSGVTFVAGTTYSGYDFSGRDITVNNVTLRGCRIKGAAPNDHLMGIQATGVTLDYCTYAPANSSPPTTLANSYQFAVNSGDYGSTFAPGLTMTNCDIWGFGNAITTVGDYTSNRILIQDCWLHDACLDSTYHTDGIGVLNNGETGKGIIVDHCMIQSGGNTNGIAFQNGTFSNDIFTNNVFGGFGYCIAIGVSSGMGTSIWFTNNEFWTLIKPVFGPMYPELSWCNTSAGSTFRRNKWRTVPDASMLSRFPWLSGLTWQWGASGNDGKYWIPDGTDASGVGFSDSSFVSSTDFTG
jgi:hypothetical protein